MWSWYMYIYVGIVVSEWNFHPFLVFSLILSAPLHIASQHHQNNLIQAVDTMGLLTVIRKQKIKDKEIRVLML